MSQLRALLEYLIRPLVDRPDQVQLNWVETPDVSLFYLTASRGDLGRILGKEGQTIEDIRRVMEAVAAHLGREVIIDVVEPPKKRSGRKRAKSAKSKPSASQSKKPAAKVQPQAYPQGQAPSKNKHS
jgi:hypothetical protein